MNTTGKHWYDKKSRQGAIEINGLNQWVGIFPAELSWDEKNCKPRMGYGVRVANDWNMSNVFWLKARTITQLISKIEKHQYKLVK